MSPNFEYIAVVLDDYCDMQTSGFIPTANRYPVADVQEQVELLEHLKPVANEVLARRIAELERQLSEQTALVFDLTAERDTAWQELREIREAIGANPEESTADEVRRVLAQKDNLHKAMEQFQDQSTHWHQQSQQLAAELAALATFRDEVVGVMNNSQGVSGWHHNHAIATWDELFPVVPDFESPAQCLRDVKADAVISAVKYCNHYMAFPVSRGNVADAVISVDELTTYAAGVKAGKA